MRIIIPTAWVPADGLKLEENARTAIRATENTLVVAGPGSGKTELLAQKACYLLQTNTCTYPRRILAISFKRDAAFNLGERVKRRCGENLSHRFDSFTFDSFAKQLLDRFRNGIPHPYSIAGNYEIMAKPKQAKPEIGNAFRVVNNEYFQTNAVKFEEFISSVPLPHDCSDPDKSIIQAAWLYLTNGNPPKVDFKMVMRLAEYIMASNPIIKSYLQQTYSHVFLDEFQDTTYLQYDFLRTCFDGSQVNYTAVGDDKQTIMGWAGAMPNIFETYMADVEAERLPLVMNFRSAPKLVNLQNYLVKELLGKTDFAQPSPDWEGGQGEARICFFNNQEDETTYLLSQIKHWIEIEAINPRDICILVKQLPGNYTTHLVESLAANGIRARDEGRLQDLLTEEATVYVINFLKVIFSERFDKESDAVFKFLCSINLGLDDRELLKLKRNYLDSCRQFSQKYRSVEITADILKQMVITIIMFAGQAKIKNTYIQYQQGNWLKSTMQELLKCLGEYYSQAGNMNSALDALCGKDSIPIMTTHKSKGLEYHTMVFVGLEDGAFWTYPTQADSDNNLLFVALSRAKERVLFTFCSNRGGPQIATDIVRIHELLKASPDVTVLDL